MVRLRLMPGTRIIDWLFEDGIIVDKEKAYDGTPCKCFEGHCFHEGVIGQINVDPDEPEWHELLCGERSEEFDAPIRNRVRTFYEASKDCPDSREVEEEARAMIPQKRLKCICMNMREKGLDVCGVGKL